MLEDINRACTLFVGDLSSCCTEENLQTAFGQYGKVKHVRIQQIKDKHSGQKVSAGYGFVRMFSPEQAEIAMASIDGTLIAGRQVRVRYATYHTEDASKVESRMSLYVKYVAKTQTAYTNEEIIRELFSKFGVVVDVTIRKQFLNSRKSIMRGYAFVHYTDDIDGLQSALNLLTYYPNILYNHYTADMQFNEHVINETGPNLESIRLNGVDLTKEYVLYTMSPSKSLEAALNVVQQCQSIESLTMPPMGSIGQYTKPDAEPRVMSNNCCLEPRNSDYPDNDSFLLEQEGRAQSTLYNNNAVAMNNLQPSRVSMHNISMQETHSSELQPECESTVPHSSLLNQRALKYAQSRGVEQVGYVPGGEFIPASQTVYESQYTPRVSYQGTYAHVHTMPAQHGNRGIQDLKYRPRVMQNSSGLSPITYQNLKQSAYPGTVNVTQPLPSQSIPQSVFMQRGKNQLPNYHGTHSSPFSGESSHTALPVAMHTSEGNAWY